MNKERKEQISEDFNAPDVFRGACSLTSRLKRIHEIETVEIVRRYMFDLPLLGDITEENWDG